MSKLGLLLLYLLASLPAWPQHRVNERNSYHRVICVVPMIGSGTWDDPKRPMFAPTAAQMGRGKSGILAYYHEPTDDGQAAVVVFVAVDRASLKPILTASSAQVQVFDISNLAPSTASTAVASASSPSTGVASAGSPSPGAPPTAVTSVAGATAALTAVLKSFDWNRFAPSVQ